MKIEATVIEDRRIVIGIKDCHRCDIFKQRNPDIRCLTVSEEPVGLGDTIAKLAEVFFEGIEEIETCRRCKIRQAFWNRIFPYFWKVEWKDKRRRQHRNAVLRAGERIYPVVLNENMKVVPISEVDKDFEKFVTEFEEEFGIQAT